MIFEKKLTNAIENNKNKKRFHTPGHAGTLLKNDITELDYSDNLISPENILKELEKNIASIYNVEACFISTQGATHNIFQAIYACGEEGAFLIVGKTHVSIFNAMRVFKYKTYHTDVLDFNSIPEDVKTIIVTSPNYEGKVLDLEKICSEAHSRNIRVIVDASHGSHFAFSQLLPKSATKYGDLVIHSLHKTLNVITGGSVLLCKKEYADRANLCRKLLHTTSPSYVTITSIENAIYDIQTRGESEYRKVINAIESFKSTLPKEFSLLENDDKTRVVLVSKYSGKALSRYLSTCGVEVEMAIENRVVLIVTPWNFKGLKKVSKVLKYVQGLEVFNSEEIPYSKHDIPTLLKFEGEPIKVKLEDAVNKKSYLEVGIYPPGVPLVYSNDLLSQEVIDTLLRFRKSYDLFGLDNGFIYVIK